MSEYQLRCSLCGTVSDAEEQNVGQLLAAKDKHVHICQPCQAKIKFESDQKYK
ncbi:DUF2197 domain-containing protein [Effusibacillus consociatus]|uniref:DUF2197 domain-containing protein n=1 Tax=Effusibacillus consociatus TaxID=1117041 RepID=A0ABV9Q7Z6_9BACL